MRFTQYYYLTELNYNKKLLDIIKKLKEYSPKYEEWYIQIQKEKITDKNLNTWLQNHLDYWDQKDRKYGNYLKKLLEV